MDQGPASTCARRRRATSSPIGWRWSSLVGTLARRLSSSCARAAAWRSRAIRDSEPAAESLGVDSYRTKLLVYVLTAAGTGMVGALIYLQKARISPDAAFSVLDWTAYVIFIVVIGGIGTIEGPIIGAIVFYLLQNYLADFGAWYLILLGALGIVIMLFAPKGLWGLVAERYRSELFPTRRRLVVDARDGNCG